MFFLCSGEHLWPRSYGLTDGPSLSDLHNICPTDVNGKIVSFMSMSSFIYWHRYINIVNHVLMNSSRGNKFYGECCVRTSNYLKPASKESASDTESDKER